MRNLKPAATSVCDRLARWSAELGDHRAYTFLESGDLDAGHLTWRALDRQSEAIAAGIRKRVDPGARVLLLFPPGLDFVAALFGAFRARAIAVPAYPPAGTRSDRVAARLRGVIADAGVALVVADAAVTAKADILCGIVPELRSLQWFTVEEDPGGHLPDRREPGPEPRDIAVLQYTSGSTSAPRGVMVTHGNLLHNLDAAARLGLHDGRSVSVSWLPVNHDMGLLQGVLQPAFSGFAAWLMPPVAFLQRPLRWLHAISTLRATHSGGPNFAFDLCARRISETDCASLELSAWRVAFSGSEPVRAATIDAFERTFSRAGFRRTAFRPAYGLAESTLLVASTRPDQAPRTLTVDAVSLRQGIVVPRAPVAGTGQTSPVVGCGWTGADTRIEIVDPATCLRCGPQAVGEIWVKGGSVARGYWRRPAESAATFDGRLAATGEGGFLRTGDLGFVHDRELFVTGRIKDTMIVRGLKHDPRDVELTVEAAHVAVRAGGCAAFRVDAEREQVAVAAEIEARQHACPADRHDHVFEAIRIAVARDHGIQLSTIVLLPPGALPRTTSGKIQRYLCRERLHGGLPTEIARWEAPAEPWSLERTA